jgi:hypothetical protein
MKIAMTHTSKLSKYILSSTKGKAYFNMAIKDVPFSAHE